MFKEKKITRLYSRVSLKYIFKFAYTYVCVCVCVTGRIVVCINNEPWSGLHSRGVTGVPLPVPAPIRHALL